MTLRLVPHSRNNLADLLTRHLQWMRERNFSPATIDTRRRWCGAFVHWCADQAVITPEAITHDILEAYQSALYRHRTKMGEPLAFGTQAARLSPVRAFCAWLERQDIVATNPASRLELPRSEHRLPYSVLSANEVEVILNTPDTSTPGGLRDRAVMEVLYASAIRRSELCALKTFHIDANRVALFIRRGKGRRDRVVPLGLRALAWIDRYVRDVRHLHALAKDPGHVFLSRRGHPLKPKYLSDRVHAHIVKSGVRDFGACHTFRHAAATLMHEAGADIRHIQAFLGHSSLHTTQTYTRVDVSKLAEVHARTHPSAASE